MARIACSRFLARFALEMMGRIEIGFHWHRPDRVSQVPVNLHAVSRHWDYRQNATVYDKGGHALRRTHPFSSGRFGNRPAG